MFAVDLFTELVKDLPAGYQGQKGPRPSRYWENFDA